MASSTSSPRSASAVLRPSNNSANRFRVRFGNHQQAYIGDVRRFRNAKALAAFIGVGPRLRLSGSSVKGRSMLSRTGHAEVRHTLYMPGLMALRHNPTIRLFGQRLRATGLAPKAVVAAAMRKLVHLNPFRSTLRPFACDVQA